MENGESMSRETAREIDAAAAAWAARVDRGLSPPESEALDAWLAVDTRRAGAYARARAVALPHAGAPAANFARWRSGAIRTTFHARPTWDIAVMISPDGSISYHRSPW